jgi:hypothetical protein
VALNFKATPGGLKEGASLSLSPKGLFFCFKISWPDNSVGTGLSTPERSNGHRQQEGVPQRVHGLEDAHVLDQGLVP